MGCTSPRSKTPYTPINNYQCNPMNLSFLINSHTYKIEHHQVITSDGYILTMHRIFIPIPETNPNQTTFETETTPPLTAPKKPILLLHGMLLSSDTWFLGGQNKSLGYYLVDNGFDVWLGNTRGNKYSQSHTNPSITPEEFFSFSLDEGGTLDIEAYYKYILEKTMTQKLTLCGYSNGGLQAIMGLSDSSTTAYINEKTERLIMIAPAIYMSYSQDSFQSQEFIDDFVNKSKEMKIYNVNCGNSNGDQQHLELMKYMRKRHSFKMEKMDVAKFDNKTDGMLKLGFCDVLNYIFGSHQCCGSRGTKLILGDGTSVNCLYHYFQLLNHGVKIPLISKFDFGEKGNLERYQSEKPPAYNVENIKVKVDVILGGRDLTCNYQSAETFAYKVNGIDPNDDFDKKISEKKKLVNVHVLEDWLHATFLAPKNPKLFFDILDQIFSDKEVFEKPKTKAHNPLSSN